MRSFVALVGIVLGVSQQDAGLVDWNIEMMGVPRGAAIHQQDSVMYGSRVLASIDNNGEILWRRHLRQEIISVASRGSTHYSVVSGSTGICLVAYSDAGQYLWTSPSISSQYHSIQASVGGIAVGFEDSVYFIDRENGKVSWNRTLKSLQKLALINGKLFAMSKDELLEIDQRSGELLHSYQSPKSGIPIQHQDSIAFLLNYNHNQISIMHAGDTEKQLAQLPVDAHGCKIADRGVISKYFFCDTPRTSFLLTLEDLKVTTLHRFKAGALQGPAGTFESKESKGPHTFSILRLENKMVI